jgi:hypothetical protein
MAAARAGGAPAATPLWLPFARLIWFGVLSDDMTTRPGVRSVLGVGYRVSVKTATDSSKTERGYMYIECLHRIEWQID